MDESDGLVASTSRNDFEDESSQNTDGRKYYSKSPEMFFRDGKRRIDFVLAYEQSKSDKSTTSKRHAFLVALAEQGIEIEVEDCCGHLLASTNHDDVINYPLDNDPGCRCDATGDCINALETAIRSANCMAFVKLHVQWNTLVRVAEVLQLRKPLKQIDVERLEVKDDWTCTRCLNLDPRWVLKLPRRYRAAFTRDRIHLFDIPDDVESFFTPAERSLVVDYVLKRTGTYALSHTSASTNGLLCGGDDEEGIGIVEAVDVEAQADVGPGVDQVGRRCSCKHPPPMLTQADLLLEQETQARLSDIQLAEHDKLDLGVDGLIREGVFAAAYPLHDPSREMQELLEKRRTYRDPWARVACGSRHTQAPWLECNMHTLLTNHWSSIRRIAKNQPLDYVRLYYGESVAFYFAWLGLYTYWLLPVGVFGLLVFLLSAVDINDSTIVHDVCEEGGSRVMCPLCSQPMCHLWLLNASCFSSKMTHLLDNFGTVLFAVFMAIWSTLFMEYWKRYQNILAHQWNVQNLEPIDEPPRPEFIALIKKHGYKATVNPVTNRKEPRVPFWSRKFPFTILSCMTVLFGILLCLAALVGVIFYRLVVSAILVQNENVLISTQADLITTLTSSVLNLACIYPLNVVYALIAQKLTELENHRTQSEYDNSLTLKLYLLQFVNFYSSIFYIAFIQGSTAELPGDNMFQPEGCGGGNCLFQLFIQLAIIMVGKQFINFITENALPLLLRLVRLHMERHRLKAACKQVVVSACDGNESVEADDMDSITSSIPPDNNSPILYHCRYNYTLIDPGSRPLFEEYLEMLLQYGFITMFVPAFPIAPLFALVNNVFELRTDAMKFLHVLRRPVIKRVNNIGVWFGILSAVSSLSIRTNACLIAFTTEYLERLTYSLFYSPDFTMSGYLDFTLAHMDAARFNLTDADRALLGNSSFCRYKAFRDPPNSTTPYAYTPVHWRILAVKFAFIFVFENVALGLTELIARGIPDVPNTVSIVSRYEARVVNELLVRSEQLQAQQCSSRLASYQNPSKTSHLVLHYLEKRRSNLYRGCFLSDAAAYVFVDGNHSRVETKIKPKSCQTGQVA